jgi:hypothetical protein
MGAFLDGNKWRRTMKPHMTVTLVLTTTLLPLNSATAQEIINNKPTPSRAEWVLHYGDYYILDLNGKVMDTHIDPEKLARELHVGRTRKKWSATLNKPTP